MKPKLDAKDPAVEQLPGKRLTISTDSIAWIRELASSICLTPPQADASSADFKQYTWNSAICQAIVEIADHLLRGECEKSGNRDFLQHDSESDLPLS